MRCSILAVAGAGWVEREDGQLSSFKTDVLVTEVVERAHKKSRAAQKHDAERNLRANRELAETLRVLRRGSRVLPQGVGKVGPQEVKDRSDAEQQARDERNRKRKHENAHIDRCRVRFLTWIGTGNEANQGARHDGRKRNAGSDSGQPEQSAFNQQLRSNARAFCAKSIAHGHFARPARGAQQQQCSHVDRAEKNKNAGHAHENDKWLLKILAAGVEALRVVNYLQVGVVNEVLPEPLAARFVESELIRAKRAPKRPETGLCKCICNSRLQPRH